MNKPKLPMWLVRYRQTVNGTTMYRTYEFSAPTAAEAKMKADVWVVDEEWIETVPSSKDTADLINLRGTEYL